MHSQFQQGRAARLDGKRLTDNPHQPDAQAHHDWHDGWTSKPNPAYCVHDNCLGMVVAAALTRKEAGTMATELTLKANDEGEPVAAPSGIDRFTVRRDYD